MKKLKLSAAAGIVALAALVIAGCGASASTGTSSTSSSGAEVSTSSAPESSPVESSAPESSAPESSTAESSPPSSAAAAAELKTAKTSLGTVVVDGKGMTAYYFTKDTPNSGKSVCSGECLAAWPAITTTAAAPTVDGVTGKVGTITRDDGSKQVTIDGRPIYLWAKDKKAGDATGQGVGGVWFVIAPDGKQIGGAAAAAELKTAKTSLGTVVVDGKGMTAYYFTKDTPNSGKSVCSGECLAAWPAITTTAAAPTVDGVTGKVGTITRDDGSKQVTIDGRPIYLWAKDKKAGDVTGQGVGGVWFVIAPDGQQIGS